MRHVLEWLKTDGMYAQLERARPRSGKRKAGDEGRRMQKNKSRAHTPEIKLISPGRITGNVCHAEDPDEVRSLNVKPNVYQSYWVKH